MPVSDDPVDRIWLKLKSQDIHLCILEPEKSKNKDQSARWQGPKHGVGQLVAWKELQEQQLRE